MKRVIKAKVGSKEQAAKEFVQAWHELESSDKEKPDDRLYFESAETLLKNLTPKRLELLRMVRHEKKISIRKLAGLLKRDYKNVYQDAKIMELIGLMAKAKDGELSVPWESVVTVIPMNSGPSKAKTHRGSIHKSHRASGH